jgi:SulP family sulfate permease
MNSARSTLAILSQPRVLLPNLASGLIFGLLNIAYAVSLAAFIFTGGISEYLPAGVGIVLIAYFVAGLIIAIGSSIPGIISTPKGNICVIVALMAASIAGSNSLISQQQVLPTIVAGIMVSTIVSGVFLFTLGLFRIGNLIRFIPYPVIGGYFAGAGYLLVKGAISVMTGLGFTSGQMHLFIQPHYLMLWAPGLLFAILLFGLERRYKHFLLMPALLLAGIGLFYLLLSLTGTSIGQAKGLGLMFPDFSGGGLFPHLNIALFQHISAPALIGEAGNIITIVFLCAISALLITSVVEIGTERYVCLERELKVAGAANIVTGLGGGVISLPAATDTILSYKLGAKSRLAGISNALLCGAAILIGPSLIIYLPKPLIGGLLLFFGISLLMEWAYDSWFKLPKADYFLVLFILVVIASFGYLKGVGIGIVIAGILFAVNYSRTNVVKHELTGSTCKSKVERAARQERLLQEKGDQVYILVLQGYIFFGTADKILTQIKQRMENPKKLPLHFVVLDFHLVSNIDSSAVNSFTKLKQLSRRKQAILIFTNLNQSIRQQLQHIDFFYNKDTVFYDFPDLDHALEWCEDRILKTEEAEKLDHVPLHQQLLELFPNKDAVPRFMKYLEHKKVPAGYCLFHQGDRADNLYLIESGKVAIMLEIDEGRSMRLRTMGAGTVLGEMGLYTKKPRSATAVTEEPSSLYSLSDEALNRIQAEDPELALSFHQFVVRSLADRIVRSNDELKELMT